ncbi:MAG: hypothetical protein SGILL_010010, partial [Bacillariaceae sp.]
MPPVLDPSKSQVDGLAFLGLSLARNSKEGHPKSVTHQTAFDLNKVLDRDYEFIFSTNDDGWLVGGGEPGPPTTYKLAAQDSSHVEVMRIGTYRKEWGGVPLEEILTVMQSGDILIPQIEAMPTAVVANPDAPPELEIRFDMEPEIPNFDDHEAPLPVNWQLRFLHNQFFKKFIFPSRFCPGAFHSTILRKAEFRSEEHRKQYFAKCDAAIAEWRKLGPQPLNIVPRALNGEPLSEEACSQKHAAAESVLEDTVSVACKKSDPLQPEANAEEKKNDEDDTATSANTMATSITNLEVSLSEEDFASPSGKPATTTKASTSAAKATTIKEGDLVATTYGKGKVLATMKESESLEVELPYGRLFVRQIELCTKESDTVPLPLECHSGIWLFTDRENITHFFKPNFFPPYNTPEKKKIILDVLREEWDEKTLSWKSCGQGSMTKRPPGTRASMLGELPHLNQLDELMGNV